MTAKIGGTNSTFRENHSRIFGEGHSNYKSNCVGMRTFLTEIDIGNSGDYTPTVRTNKVVSEHCSSILFSQDSCPLHPVTLLHRICSEVKWPTPSYDLTSKEITATKLCFNMECRVLKHRATGMGPSKKKAKCAASKALLKKIKDEDGLKDFSTFISHQLTLYDKEIVSVCPSDSENSLNATSELYKMCYSHRWPLPVYGLLSVDGPLHSKLFRIGCTMPGLTELAEGKGLTKKEAKHAASLALLDKIVEDMSSDPTSCSIRNYLLKQEIEFETPQKSNKNATSLLNEMCMKYNWANPVYEFVPETDPGSNKLFTVGCSLLGHSELGTGYTKKDAKHAASSALLIKLKEYLEDSLPFCSYNPKSREKIEADYLSKTDIKKDAISTLHELCTSRNWPNPIYKTLSEDNCKDKLFTTGCYILGHTMLAKGTGSTKKIAKHAASQALLDMIKLRNGSCCSRFHLHTKNCVCNLDQTSQEAGYQLQ